MSKQHYTVIRLTLLGVSIAIGGWIAHRFFVARESGPIYTYNDTRDRADATKLFKEDWYWLSTRPYSDEYVHYLLDTRSPNNDEPQYKGKLNISVLREKDGAFVGFVAYYLRSPFEGQLLFLAVRKEFRGKRYGQLLLHHGISELFRMGATDVWLVTRVENLSAQKLYNRFGFKETSRTPEFVYFSILPHQMK